MTRPTAIDIHIYLFNKFTRYKIQLFIHRLGHKIHDLHKDQFIQPISDYFESGLRKL